MGKRESKIEQYLDDCVFALSGITRKWVSPGHRGVPDQIVIIKGLVYFVEVKTSDGVVEPWQLREINTLVKCGAKAFAVYGHVGVDSFIDMVTEDLKP